MFGLNGLNLISVGDIIKSAAYPMLLTFLFSSFGVFIGHKIFEFVVPKQDENKQSISSTSFLESVIKLLFFIVAACIFIAITYFISGHIDYTMTGFAIGNVIFGMLDHKKLINDDIAIYVSKEYLLMLLIYLPCFSVATAVQDADKILTNKSYKYTTRQYINPIKNQTKTDTLKLIGITEQNFLFTDLKNEKIYFIKSDSIVLERN